MRKQVPFHKGGAFLSREREQVTPGARVHVCFALSKDRAKEFQIEVLA
jgi:hypothetical protein